MRASGVWVIGEIGHDQQNIKSLLKAVKKDKDEMVQDNLRKSLTKITKREQGIIVLMADDDLEFCKNICLQLKKDGFRPTVAANGKTALAKIEEQIPDIVLMNLRMPEMNGLEALKSIRANEETKEVPVIMMSDLDSSVLLKQVSKCGANDYLLKPFNYEQVKDKIQNYL
jgi:CheY-like chemotaxis protein